MASVNDPHTLLRGPRTARRGWSSTTLEAVMLALVSVTFIFAAAAAHRGPFTAGRHITDIDGSVSGVSVRPGVAREVSVPAVGAAADTQLGSSRSLLHNGHRHAGVPPCPQCWIYTNYQGQRAGHCKKRRRLRDCSGLYPFALLQDTFPPDTIASLDAESLTEVALSLAKSRPEDLSSIEPFVACFEDSDCALPADDFPPLKGSAPLSVSGTLSATCRRPSFTSTESGESSAYPGICTCTYVAPAEPANSRFLYGQPSPTVSTTGYCEQAQGQGPRGRVSGPAFFAPSPEPTYEYEYAAGPPEETVPDADQYALGVVIEDEYILSGDGAAGIEKADGDTAVYAESDSEYAYEKSYDN